MSVWYTYVLYTAPLVSFFCFALFSVVQVCDKFSQLSVLSFFKVLILSLWWKVIVQDMKFYMGKLFKRRKFLEVLLASVIQMESHLCVNIVYFSPISLNIFLFISFILKLDCDISVCSLPYISLVFAERGYVMFLILIKFGIILGNISFKYFCTDYIWYSSYTFIKIFDSVSLTKFYLLFPL